jgi:hypothetical protein
MAWPVMRRDVEANQPGPPAPTLTVAMEHPNREALARRRWGWLIPAGPRPRRVMVTWSRHYLSHDPGVENR